jgi:hypothetical protein
VLSADGSRLHRSRSRDHPGGGLLLGLAEEAGLELFVRFVTSASPSCEARARKPYARPNGVSMAEPIVRVHLPPAQSQLRSLRDARSIPASLLVARPGTIGRLRPRYGVGASARSRPSCFSSAQSADGIM